MTKEDFIAAGKRLYGKVGWQAQLAADLQKSRVTINLYARGHREIPQAIALAIRGLEADKYGYR